MLKIIHDNLDIFRLGSVLAGDENEIAKALTELEKDFHIDTVHLLSSDLLTKEDKTYLFDYLRLSQWPRERIDRIYGDESKVPNFLQKLSTNFAWKRERVETDKVEERQEQKKQLLFTVQEYLKILLRQRGKTGKLLPFDERFDDSGPNLSDFFSTMIRLKKDFGLDLDNLVFARDPEVTSILTDKELGVLVALKKEKWFVDGYNQ